MPDTNTNTRTFTVRQLNELFTAVTNLDGQTVVVGQGESQKAVTVPYKFGGKARWNLTKITSKLRQHQEDFTKARDAIINDVSGGKGSIQPDDTDAIARLNKELTAALDAEVEVTGLLTVDLNDLNLAENQIPTTILSVLSPLIKED